MTAQPPVLPGKKVKIKDDNGNEMDGIVTNVRMERQAADLFNAFGRIRVQMTVEMTVDDDAQGEILR
jgi:hypothetical protein